MILLLFYYYRLVFGCGESYLECLHIVAENGYLLHGVGTEFLIKGGKGVKRKTKREEKEIGRREKMKGRVYIV